MRHDITEGGTIDSDQKAAARSVPNTTGDAGGVHERLVEGLLSGDEVAKALDIQISEASPGRAVANLLAAPWMINGYGVVHGGYLFLLADTAFAMAAATANGPAVSRHAEITFIAPVPAGTQLHAVAVERIRYGRSGIVDVTVAGADGSVYAEMRGHLQVVKRDFPASAQ